LTKSYAKNSLLTEKLSGMNEVKGFFHHIFTTRKHLTLPLPYYDYLRGKVFIEDLRDNFGQEVPYSFDIGVLIYILYDDFLRQVKKGVKNEDVAKYLLKGDKNYFSKERKQKKVIKALSQHVFEFQTEEEMEEEDTVKKAYLELRMRNSEILRGEVLIHDLEPYLNEVQMDLEKLIIIVFSDFITSIKNNGNSLDVQKSIIANILS
jgi:hypothetical protein